MKLRDKLRAYLEGWKADLPAAWRPMFKSFELDFDLVDPTLQFNAGDPLYPGRRGQAPPGAPAGSHIFHALDGIKPSQVRLVVLGQDPYPSVAHATGRAFEQGRLTGYGGKDVTTSMKRILRGLAEARTNVSAYAQAGGWARLQADLATLSLQLPKQLWDSWRNQGAIFLNVGLTISRFQSGGSPEQKRGHIPLWRPFVQHLVASLAALQPFVFVTWGDFAKQLGVTAPSWGPKVVVVDGVHPAASDAFLKPPNQFLGIAQKLSALPGSPFAW